MKKRGILCFLFCIIMCSSIDVTLKLASLRMNAIQLCFWRFLCGGLSCLPIALRTVNEQRKAKRSSVSPMLFSGLLMVVLSTVLYQVALSVGKASVVSVLYSCSPIFVAIASWAMLGERLRWDTVLSSALYVAAVAVLILGGRSGSSLLSCILILLSAALLAVYNVLGQRWSDRFPPSVYVSFTFLFGALELLLLVWISHIPSVAELNRQFGLELFVDIPLLDHIDGEIMPALLYVGIVATGMNFLAMQVATKELGAVTTSLIFYFKLIFAPLLALVILKEPLGPPVLAAMALVFAALLVKNAALQGIRKKADGSLRIKEPCSHENIFGD